MKFHHAALAGLLVAQPLAAQDTALAPATAPEMAIAPLAQPASVLRAGTELQLRLVEELTTEGKRLRVGDRFHMVTEEAVRLNGSTVIPAGTPAVGEITDVRNKGMWGKSGKLNARLLYLSVNGRQIRLSGAFDDKGVAGGVAAVAVAAIVFVPAGFLVTGTSARVPAGTVVRGYIDEDVQLWLPGAPRAPLAVEPASAVAAATVAEAQAAPQSAFVNPPHRRPPSAR
jgi:hypothetical protein